jgi:hypothetical protein
MECFIITIRQINFIMALNFHDISQSIKKYFYLFIIILVLAALVISFLIADSIIIFSEPISNSIIFLSYASTFIIAVLTISYVLTTSKQLDEMKKEREFQYQPLPWVKEIKPTLKTPQLFSKPEYCVDADGVNKCKHKEFIISSILNIDFTIKNYSEHPAVCIDVLSRLIIQNKRDTISIVKRIPILEADQIISTDSKNGPSTVGSFYFDEDPAGDIIQALLANCSEMYPTFQIRILFRNVIGGHFVIENSYQLFPTEEHTDTLKNWIGVTVSFPKQFSNELKEINGELKDCVFTPTGEKFSVIDKHLKNALIVKNLNLVPVEIPGKQTVKSISKEAYIKMTTGFAYSVTKAITRPDGCPLLEKNKEEPKDTIFCMHRVLHNKRPTENLPCKTSPSAPLPKEEKSAPLPKEEKS